MTQITLVIPLRPGSCIDERLLEVVVYTNACIDQQIRGTGDHPINEATFRVVPDVVWLL